MRCSLLSAIPCPGVGADSVAALQEAVEPSPWTMFESPLDHGSGRNSNPALPRQEHVVSCATSRELREAKRLWESLVEEDYAYSVVYRNLAFYCQKHEEDYARAVEIATKGLTKQPRNDDLYVILAACYRQLADVEQCRLLVETLQTRKQLSEKEASVLIDLLNYLGEHAKAAEILEATNFHVWEHNPEGLLPYNKLQGCV